MDAERWRRVERIYHAALERQPNERGALIETLCAGDGQLRSEVAQLIEADAHAGTFMDAPAWQTAAIASSGGPSAPSSVILTGRQIANYSVLNLLGAGAMGEVYRARDNKLNRDVALKVIPLALCDRPRAPVAVPAGSARPGVAEPPQHRRYLRPRGNGGCSRALSSNWSTVKRSLAYRTWRPVCRGGAVDRSPDRRSARGGARARDHPPRSQAGEYYGTETMAR